jgi:hypothetical protein
MTSLTLVIAVLPSPDWIRSISCSQAAAVTDLPTTYSLG